MLFTRCGNMKSWKKPDSDDIISKPIEEAIVRYFEMKNERISEGSEGNKLRPLLMKFNIKILGWSSRELSCLFVLKEFALNFLLMHSDYS